MSAHDDIYGVKPFPSWIKWGFWMFMVGLVIGWNLGDWAAGREGAAQISQLTIQRDAFRDADLWTVKVDSARLATEDAQAALVDAQRAQADAEARAADARAVVAPTAPGNITADGWARRFLEGYVDETSQP